MRSGKKFRKIIVIFSFMLYNNTKRINVVLYFKLI